ncbi:hypothetical protein ABW19_dt0204341 [Dactylella cylindrospora]|nr:hypothetical protein ABW19_dt0204341 [Dactylella cylindrospora]
MRVAQLQALAFDVDTTYQIQHFLWTIIELNLGVICACAPALRHLVSKRHIKILQTQWQQRRRTFGPLDVTIIDDEKRNNINKHPGEVSESSVGSSANAGSSKIASGSNVGVTEAGTEKDELDCLERGLGVIGSTTCEIDEDVEEASRGDKPRASSTAIPENRGEEPETA